MSESIARVLRLVAEGHLSAEEAGPILDALETADAAGPARDQTPDGESVAAPGSAPGSARARFARIEVRDGGKRVVDLRVPVSLGRFALGRIPGLSAQHVADVEEAVSRGSHGPILDIEDADGDGVRIVLE